MTVPEVISADAVFVPYEPVCTMKVDDKTQLERVISRIHKNVPRIEGALTSVIATLRI